ncbi:MAG: RsmB/NOP family class I SAM-dependent RNA methyltransferase [Nitrososphaera sp.]|nr:RsmB/NOP family class I SAM-dependent RNA methyltransferase [Nitrososphaera sp.]
MIPDSEESVDLATKYGYDRWLVSRFLEYVPDAQEFLSKMEKPPTQYIRANTLKIDAEALKSRLESKGFSLRHTLLPEVLAVEKASMSVGATAEYLLGLYYIQDLSSCLAVDALDIKEGQSVLDVAAAPGGKTTFISQRMNNTGSILALEPNERRARSMSFNLARCGVTNACISRMDGRRADSLGIKFDRVLLDAPCSCEGVIARDVARKTSHKPSDVEYCSGRQESLIETAARIVKPGGLLVYSTCSFAPEENEMVVDSLLQKFDNITLEPYEYGSSGLVRFHDVEFTGQLKNARRLYPHIHDTTGFFIARVRVN